MNLEIREQLGRSGSFLSTCRGLEIRVGASQFLTL